MNPNNLSFGTGTNLLQGGGPLVAQQMENNAPALSQQSPASPGFTPQMQAQPLTGSLPQGAPMNMLPQPAAQAAPSPAPIPKTEAQLIIEALGNRLKAIANMEQNHHEARMSGR